jgi:hypothetical protein
MDRRKPVHFFELFPIELTHRSNEQRRSGMRHLAQARNPYSRPWLLIPGSLAKSSRPGTTTLIALKPNQKRFIPLLRA